MTITDLDWKLNKYKMEISNKGLTSEKARSKRSLSSRTGGCQALRDDIRFPPLPPMFHIVFVTFGGSFVWHATCNFVVLVSAPQRQSRRGKSGDKRRMQHVPTAVEVPAPMDDIGREDWRRENARRRRKMMADDLQLARKATRAPRRKNAHLKLLSGRGDRHDSRKG